MTIEEYIDALGPAIDEYVESKVRADAARTLFAEFKTGTESLPMKPVHAHLIGERV